VTVLAEGDYATPPNLTRLAMAEAAAHGASYLSWPTWPEGVRAAMARAVRPQADVLRENADLLNGRTRRADAVVFLPFRRWVETADCAVLATARAANVQFDVVCEDDLGTRLATKNPPCVLVIESPSVLDAPEDRLLETFKAGGGRVIATDAPAWLADLRAAARQSIVVEGPPTVRAVVHDQPPRTIVHLLNLGVERLSSFEDKVHPAANVRLRVSVPGPGVRSVRAISADAEATRGAVPFTTTRDADGAQVEVTIPSLRLSTILVIE
jgi:hypothetical protein